MYGVWHVSILSNDNSYISLPFYSPGNGYCIIDPFVINWDNALKVYDIENNRDLFNVKIAFCVDDNIVDSKIIQFALLPARPQIENISFVYTYDWEWDDIYPNGDFSFTVVSPGASSFWFSCTDSFQFYPSFFSWGKDYEGHDRVDISYDADWGEFIYITAINEFGSARSDTICTTNYITDTDILKRIEFLKQAAHVSTVEDDTAVNVVIKPEYIEFDSLVKNASIYNIAGQSILDAHDIESIPIYGIPSGLYILVYEDQHMNIYNLKFIKR